MGEDQHRLYGLFFARSNWEKDLYRMWMTQYETGGKSVAYTGIDAPIPAFRGIEYSTPATVVPQYVLQDIQKYLLSEGLEGWSWHIPDADLQKYAMLVCTHGYIFVIFPVWFRVYPAFYQAILMFRESNGDVLGAGFLGSTSFWPEGIWHAEPLVTNVVSLDGHLIFRQERKRTLPIRWSADPFFRRWSHPRTIFPLPGDSEELRQPMNAGTIPIRDLVDQLMGSNIYHPVHIKLDQHHFANPIVTEDYTRVTTSHGGRRLYGVKNAWVQEFDIDYVRYFIVRDGVETEMTLPIGRYLRAAGSVRQVIIRNSHNHVTIRNMTIRLLNAEGIQQAIYTVGDILPKGQASINMAMNHNFGPNWTLDASYTVML